MSRLLLFFCVVCCCLGCQTLAATDLPAAQPTPTQLWEQGQVALRAGRVEEAIGLYQQSLLADPTLMHNHLSLAAAFLERGDSEAACLHLERYLSAHPENLAVRSHYAELLRKQHRLPEARAEYERFDTEAQELGESAVGHLVHCHSRLMEIAEEEEDEYAEHLHRGIGLYHLACERSAQPTAERQTVESLLCKAAGELTMAGMERPDEARPKLYLYEVWTRLAQRQPALRCLRAADDAAPFSFLTPHEQERLQLACRKHETLSVRR
jgi:tetratricopeptide (TPR) repeat protein